MTYTFSSRKDECQISKSSSQHECDLKFCKSLDDNKFQDIEGTLDFCSQINNAFDIFNCRTKYSKSPFIVSLDEKSYDLFMNFSINFEKYI